MFDIGFSEMILLAAIALVAIGPKQLPEVARVVGRMLNEFKRATGDLTKTIVDAREGTESALNDVKNFTTDFSSSVQNSLEPKPSLNTTTSEAPVSTPVVEATKTVDAVAPEALPVAEKQES